MPLEEARRLAFETDKETYEIKQKYLDPNNIVRDDIIEELRDLSCMFIKQYLKEQLLEEK